MNILVLDYSRFNIEHQLIALGISATMSYVYWLFIWVNSTNGRLNFCSNIATSIFVLDIHIFIKSIVCDISLMATTPFNSGADIFREIKVNIMNMDSFASCVTRSVNSKFPFYDKRVFVVRDDRSQLSVLTPKARFMGPTWGQTGADRTVAGATWATWTLLSGKYCLISWIHNKYSGCQLVWNEFQSISYIATDPWNVLYWEISELNYMMFK